MRLKCQLLTSQVHRGGNVGRNRRQRRDNKIDVGIQTENDIVTDESPDFMVTHIGATLRVIKLLVRYNNERAWEWAKSG